MPELNEITTFAETDYRNQSVKFGIKTDDRRRHMYVIGKTGMGKSTLLENMIIQDIQAGRGVCVVDPHGELVEKVINFIPSSRVNDVVYFNPADLDFPIAFNVLEKVGIEQRHLVVSGLIGVFKKIWADSWGPRLEYVLHHAISALLEYPGSTLLGIMRMLTDKSFRSRVVDKISDPVVKSFWIDEYSKYPDRFQAEAIAPIQNKVGRFLSSSLIRNMVGQVQSSFSMREVMDNKKILLINLAKGRVGEDNSALLGAMLITKIQLAAMSRIDIPEEERNDFYLYVDEFQNFATESFANILSEARKYRLNLIIAHQYIEQIEEDIAAAVFGNVGTIVSFRVGATDAEFLEKEFFPVFVQENLVNIPKYQVYLKLMIDGVASEAFSARTLPPVQMTSDTPLDVKEKVIKVTRERYSKSRALVEDKIMRWSENRDGDDKFTGKANASVSSNSEKNSDKKAKKPPKTGKKYNCTYCGKETELNFEPDLSKAIYCEDCLKKSRAGKIPPPSSVKVLNKTKEEKPSETPPIKTDDDGFISLSDALKMDKDQLYQKLNITNNNNNQNKKPSTTSKTMKPGEVIKF
jgi:CxxC-x17-CxxC domain-containing protein